MNNLKCCLRQIQFPGFLISFRSRTCINGEFFFLFFVGKGHVVFRTHCHRLSRDKLRALSNRKIYCEMWRHLNQCSSRSSHGKFYIHDQQTNHTLKRQPNRYKNPFPIHYWRRIKTDNKNQHPPNRQQNPASSHHTHNSHQSNTTHKTEHHYGGAKPGGDRRKSKHVALKSIYYFSY
jgi:hypothetical protein